MTEEQRISQDLEAVENAVAQQRLEGLEVPAGCNRRNEAGCKGRDRGRHPQHSPQVHAR